MTRPSKELAATRRRLAREIQTGTYKPSAIGKKSREHASRLSGERNNLVEAIQDSKRRRYGTRERWSEAKSYHAIRQSPRDHRIRSVEELRKIANAYRLLDEGDIDFEGMMNEVDDADFYH